MRWSIRAKLTVLVLAVLTPLVAGAIFESWRETEEERERIQEQLVTDARGVARHLDEILVGQIENLLALATGRSLERLAGDDLAAFLARVRATYPFVHRLLTAGVDGWITAASGPRAPALSFVTEDALRVVLRSREPQVGPPHPSPADQRLVVPLMAPLIGRDGAPRGVVVAELDLRALSGFLHGMPRGADTDVTIVASDGALVAHSAAGRGDDPASVPAAAAAADLAALARERGAAAEWSGERDAQLAGVVAMRRAPWMVVAMTPSEKAYAPVFARLRASLLGLGATTFVALLIAWLISRRMSRAVRALSEGARSLAAGAGPPISVQTTDELAELAEQLNRAMQERRAAEDALAGRQRRLRALAEVNLALSRQLDLEPLLQQITVMLGQLTGAYNVVLWEADQQAERLVRRAWTPDPSIGSVDLPSALSFAQGGTGWVARHRQALFVEDITEDARVMAQEWARSHDLLVFAGVPVMAGDQLLGVLTLNLKRGTALDAEDGALLLSFASQAAVAIRNARLFAQAEARRRAAETLADLGRALAQALDPDVVAQQIADSVRTLFGAQSSGLYRLGPETGDLIGLAVSGDVVPTPGTGVVFPHGTGVVGVAVRERRPVATSDLLTDPRVTLTAEGRRRLEQASSRAVLAVPLVVKGAVIGALGVGDREGREFGPDDISLAQAFADQAALALENARLYAEATRRRREAEELAQLARTLTESLDVADVGRRIVESMLPLFGVTSSRLALRQPDESLELIAAAGKAREFFRPGHAIAPGIGIVGRAIAEGRPVCCADVLAEPGLALSEDARRYVEEAGDHAVVAAPLTVKGETIGALLLNDRAGRAFSQAEITLLRAFADQAALALENARLHEQTRLRVRHLDSLREVVEQILVPISLEHRLNLVARKAVELFDADRVAVALWDDGRKELVIRAGYALWNGELGLSVEMGKGALGVAAARREGVLVNDYTSWPDRRREMIEGRSPLQAVISYPLLVRDQVIGVLAVGVLAPGRRFTTADLDRLASLAAPAALAIEHSRLYGELETRLRQLEETQAQLVQAGKMSAVGQLVSGVAHELNNPLAVVIGHGQLLLARALPPHVRRPVEAIVSQGNRMARIVQGLLLFARQRQPERRALDVREILDQTLALRAAQLRLSSIRVETAHAPDVPPAAGDPNQLQQVFLNLLLNAEQAILGSRVGDCIRIGTASRVEAGTRWVVVEIADNGPGIPEEVLPRIFEPFFTTKEVGEGTGLGLSVSYGIVEQHGGRLTVRSRPGRTAFSVELPATEPDPETSATGAGEPRSAGLGRRALVVDDEPTVIDFLTTLLREAGWQVDVSPGGRAALERLRARGYDLIVSDIRMPDGSGEEFYRAVTAEWGDLAGRFLFITGDTANAAAWKFIEESRVPVLEKPFTPDALLEAVDRLTS